MKASGQLKEEDLHPLSYRLLWRLDSEELSVKSYGVRMKSLQNHFPILSTDQALSNQCS
jgi:hypothetical protein